MLGCDWTEADELSELPTRSFQPLLKKLPSHACSKFPFSSTNSNHIFSFQTKPTNPQPNIKMSAPNANKPNEGIVGQIGNSLNNAAQYVSETVQGSGATASKEANKEKAKGNSADDSISGRVSGAMGAASDKMDEKKHETSAEANKRSI
ncbi:hypothetical protein E4T42_04301 [Aureobasidium subglaciale]|nr:hypothetical protein E4T42_04301 [Aureobasidium subglaciale]